MALEYRIICECGARLRVAGANVGRTGACPKCGNPIYVDPETVETFTTTPTTQVPAVDTSGTDPGVDWNVGDVFYNLYEVTGLLGQGGMGKVYKVHHRAWKLDLAVKCPKPRLLERVGGVENFERECETWVNLGLHPHTVSCYYVRRISNIPRIFAEYVDGGSLSSWIRRGTLYEGPPAACLARIVSIAIQIAWGLHHAHAYGLVHRDVKAANVMLRPDATAKVTDFGLAKAFASVNEGGPTPRIEGRKVISAAGMTPAYCSPEQQQRGAILTRATDIWSWALCIIEMLAGRVFWTLGIDGPEALQRLVRNPGGVGRVPSVPKSLADVLGWCLAWLPEARPATMMDAAAVLTEVYREITGQDYPRTPPKPVEGRAESLNNRAVSLVDLGKQEEAKRCWAEALTLVPGHAESTFNVELLRWRAGEITDDVFVERLCEVALLHPGDPAPAYLLAEARLEQGDYGAAIRSLEEIQESEEYGGTVAGMLRMARERHSESGQLLRSLEGHADAVMSVAVHPESTYALTGSEDNTVRLWSLTTGRCVRVFEGHAGSVRSVAISPGGAWLVSGSDDRSVRLWALAADPVPLREALAISASPLAKRLQARPPWDMPYGACVRALEEHRGAVTALAFFADGVRIISGSADHTATVWRLDLERSMRTFTGHSAAVTGVSVSLDGEWAATSSLDGSVRLWEVSTGEVKHAIHAHDGGTHCVWLRGDAKFILSGGQDGLVHMWRVSDGQCVQTYYGHTGPVHTVAMTSDERYVMSGSRDASVRVWGCATGRCLRTFRGHVGTVNALALTKGGSHIVSGGLDNTAKLWRVGSSRTHYAAPLVLCRALRSEDVLTLGAAFGTALEEAAKALNANNAPAAAAQVRKARDLPGYRRNTEAVKTWCRLYLKLPKRRLASAWEGATFAGHRGKITSCRLTRDGRRLFSAGADNTLRLWDTETGACVRTFDGGGSAVNSISLSFDDRFALTTDDDGDFVLWDLRAGKQTRIFDRPGVSIESAQLSGDGRFAVSVGWEITLWDTAAGRSIRTFESKGAVSVALSRDGTTMFTGGPDGALNLWDMVQGACVRSFPGHTGLVRCVQASEDGRLLLSASGNPWDASGELMLWDVASATCLHRFDGHPGGIHAAVLSADGKFVFSGHKDGSFLLWDARTGEGLRRFKGQGSGVEELSLARDGRFIIIADADGGMKLWILDWDLDAAPSTPWVDDAQPYLDGFILEHAAPIAPLPSDRRPSEKDIAQAFRRQGRATWTEDDLRMLMYDLACAGYGYIEPDQVRKRLERIAGKVNLLSRRKP